jgi:hypothetical protein
MSLLQRVCKTLGMLSLVIVGPAIVSAQSSYVPQAAEYLPAGGLAGDQTHPRISLNSSGGFLVWDDNITDGSGLGITAVKLDSSFSPKLGIFRVNQQGTNDQEKPNLTLLKNGGAAFVWQGGKQGFQHIYARFLSSSNTWVTGDVQVNTSTTKYQVNPTISTLTNGNVVVAWSSYNQESATSLQGVYAQLLSPTGQKIGNEFLVNQYTSFNQRNPAVTGLPNGNFVVAWVSEQERFENSADIYARLYTVGGTPVSNEFLVNTGTNVCANPSVAGASDGTFIIAWSERDALIANNSWDISVRQFSSTGTGGIAHVINTQRYGDQYAPQISVRGTDYLVIWTSMGQDGSREGVYGQFLGGNGALSGSEFRVNTTTASQQFQPAVAADGTGRFLVAWSSFAGLQNSFDLYAQRFATFQQPLVAPDPPAISPISSSRLSVTWSLLAGFNVNYYELYVDGSPTPIITTNNLWALTGLAPATTHSFRLDYVLMDGRRSPLSTTVTGKTWDEDNNGDGIPDDWQALYWGSSAVNWPAGTTRLGANGPTIQQVFLWGSNPLDPSTWLTMHLTPTPQGLFLSWNTKPGYLYQVESSADFITWSNLGALRFAAGTSDSVYLGMSNKNYYRIKRVRY